MGRKLEAAFTPKDEPPDRFVPWPRKTRFGGFSLVEILIALAVVSIALLGLIAAFAYGVRANEHSQRMSTALGYANQLMDLVRSNNYAWDDGTLPGSYEALDAPPLDGEAPADPGFTRSIEVTQGIGAGHKAAIARVVVRVHWNERGVQKSVELSGFSVDLTP